MLTRCWLHRWAEDLQARAEKLMIVTGLVELLAYSRGNALERNATLELLEANFLTLVPSGHSGTRTGWTTTHRSRHAPSGTHRQRPARNTPRTSTHTWAPMLPSSTARSATHP